ncbi:hypothetical protein DFJ74DRAFT_775419 [Hyaloraphidium curvatum]|nr:hypothetical protein DFJ74DRAFT_775419 [Hyaloraphidium curvatum]
MTAMAAPAPGSSMKAVLLSSFAPSVEEIRAVDAPVPACGPGDVLIRVSNIAPTFGDGLVAQGKYQTKPKLPFVPGTELSGHVVAVGSAVKRFEAGMRVVGFANAGVQRGTWAEYVVFPENDPTGQYWLYECPPQLSNRECAAVLANYPTALYALVNCGGIPPPGVPDPNPHARPVSERILLVHGGAGGMGTSSIHVAKGYLGVGTVIATCSTPEKAAVARACGADFVVDYTKDKWWEEVRAIARERTPKGVPESQIGVDYVVETVGNSLEGSIKCTRWMGRILVIGFAGGEMPRVRPNVLLVKGISVHGVWLGGVTSRAEWEEVNRRVLCGCFGLSESSRTLGGSEVGNGREPRFRPVLYPRTFIGVGRVAEAIGTMYGRQGYGKVVVDVWGEEAKASL